MIYAVIDTNVIVSSYLTHHEDSATRQVVNAVYEGRINPLPLKMMTPNSSPATSSTFRKSIL